MTGFKMELTCNLMGHIVDFAFPAGLGGASDFAIHQSRVQRGEKVFLPWESQIGDGAYFGATGLIAEFPESFNWQTVNGRVIKVPLTATQKAARAPIRRERQKIEHIVKMVRGKHNALRLPWDGKTSTLIALVHVTVHMTNIKIKMCGVNGTAANGNSRYSSVIGPWPHDGRIIR